MHLNKNVDIPRQHHEDEDAGFDLQTCDYIEILPGERTVIYTRLTFLIPRGLYRETKGKSEVTLAGGLVLPGVINHGFTGEIKVQMANISKIQTLHFFPGE